MRSSEILKPFEDKVIPLLRSEYTPNIYNSNVISVQENATDKEKILHSGEILFIQYDCLRSRQFGRRELGNCNTPYQYNFQVEFFAEDSKQNLIKTFFEHLEEIIFTELGSNWNGLGIISGSETTYPQIQYYGLVHGKPVFVGRFSFFILRD